MSHHPPDQLTRKNRAARTLAETQQLLRKQEIEMARVVDVILTLNPHSTSLHVPPMVDGFTQTVGQTLPDHSGVLIFGSAVKPGGGWLNGAKAQEEDVSLASTWGEQARLGGATFYTESGKLGGAGPDKILVAQGAWLYNAHGVPLDTPKPATFISIAAPNLRNPQTAQLPAEQRVDLLARRIATALEQWHILGTPHVLLGAIGCGVFAWEGQDSAKALGLALAHHIHTHGRLMPITLAMPDAQLTQIFSQVLAAPDRWKLPPSSKWRP